MNPHYKSVATYEIEQRTPPVALGYLYPYMGDLLALQGCKPPLPRHPRLVEHSCYSIETPGMGSSLGEPSRYESGQLYLPGHPVGFTVGLTTG